MSAARRRQFWLAAAATVTGLAPVGCIKAPAPDAGEPAAAAPAAPAQPVNIGAPLYKPAPAVKIEATTPQAEPVVIYPAVIQYDLKVQIPAAEDGVIELIASPVNGPVNPGEANVVYHPRDPKKSPYRKLKEGDKVTAGQTLARLDEQLVAAQAETAQRMIDGSDRAIEADDRALKSYEKLLNLQEELLRKGNGSLREVEEIRASVARLSGSLVGNQKEKAKAEGELIQANTQMRRYWCQSPVNGRVWKVLKSPGEFARAGDTILEIQSTDRVRVEGKLPVEYAATLKPGTVAYIEPAVQLPPEPFPNWHLREVTAVAVTGAPGRPLIVSAGLDASALVWDFTSTKRSSRLPHPSGVGVRALACTTRPGAKPTSTAATGGDDGKVRLWDLSNPDKIPTEPSAVLDEPHSNPVTAAAFSPDGAFLATASGREVYVWDVLAKKRKYALPAEHRDAVSSLAFVPQGRLITTCRDGVIRSWNLGTDGAQLADPVIDHRSGSVDELGVTADGSRVLFDRDGGRLDVLSLADGRSVGTIVSPGGTRFGELAIFHPNGQVVLTAGGDADGRGELQLWDLPASGGRASERRRLATPNRAPVTCAAFSADPAHPFVVVGTAAGGVHVWTPPNDKAKRIAGRVESVLPSDARSVQVRVVVENLGETDLLPDRGTAAIVIDPSAVATAAVLEAPAPRVVRAGGAAPVGEGVVPANFAEPADPTFGNLGSARRPIVTPPLAGAAVAELPEARPAVAAIPPARTDKVVGPRATPTPPLTSIPLKGGK